MNIATETTQEKSRCDNSLPQSSKLPLSALLAFAAAGFITVVTEALPAGVLPQISSSLSISPSLAGQLTTIYAIGSLMAAIPLTTVTQGMRRRPLLLIAIIGFAIANTITALSGSYVVSMAARFLAGVSAGLLWALIAGYAARLVPTHLEGRAIAIAMAGIPLALSFGVPLGTLLGTTIGWRLSFGIMSVATLFLIVWVVAKVPDFSGQKTADRQSISRVFALPGVRPILFATLAFALAHNLLYTYIAPFLQAANIGGRTDAVLLTFGLASLISLWGTGALIDRWLRELMLTSVFLFILSALALWLWRDSPVAIYLTVATWGLGFGGFATLAQTANAKAAGESADVAQSLFVTTWNIAIASGGIIGGLLLQGFGVDSFSPVLLVLLIAALIVVWMGDSYGFPSVRFKPDIP